MFVIGFTANHRVGNKNSIPGRKNQKVGSIFLIVGNKSICQCDEDVQSHEKWGYPQSMKGNLVSLHIPFCAATTFSLRQHVALNRTNAIPEIPRLIETTIILIPSVPLKKSRKRKIPFLLSHFSLNLTTSSSPIPATFSIPPSSILPISTTPLAYDSSL